MQDSWIRSRNRRNRSLRILTEPAVYLVGKQVIGIPSSTASCRSWRELGKRQRHRGRSARPKRRGATCYMSLRQAATGRELGVPHAHQGSRARLGPRTRGLELHASPACRAASRTNWCGTARASAYSQLTQRYVDESVAEYVEPDIIASDPELHAIWLEAVRSLTRGLHSGSAEKLNAEARRPARPRPPRCSRPTPTAPPAARRPGRPPRSVLPNATETKIFVTANARAAPALHRTARQPSPSRKSASSPCDLPRCASEGLRRTSSATTPRSHFPMGRSSRIHAVQEGADARLT